MSEELASPNRVTAASRSRNGRDSCPFLLLLAAVTLFGLANSSDTLLLLRARDAGLSAAQLAFAYAAFNLAYATLAIPLGALSDRIGRRPLLLVAWGTYALVYAGFAYADAAWQLWLLFIAYGLYFAAAEGTLKAWVSSLVPPERRGAAYGGSPWPAGPWSCPRASSPASSGTATDPVLPSSSGRSSRPRPWPSWPCRRACGRAAAPEG